MISFSDPNSVIQTVTSFIYRQNFFDELLLKIKTHTLNMKTYWKQCLQFVIKKNMTTQKF